MIIRWRDRPPDDAAELETRGVIGVFNSGTPISDIVSFLTYTSHPRQTPTA